MIMMCRGVFFMKFKVLRWPMSPMKHCLDQVFDISSTLKYKLRSKQ